MEKLDKVGNRGWSSMVSPQSQAMKCDVALNMLAFHCYPWETMLEQIAALGVDFIEPVYISKYAPGLQEEYFTYQNAHRLLATAGQAGLKVRSVASHMDMGNKDSVSVFWRRMEFARELGAAIIITNTSSLENERQFFDNMTTLSRIADNLEIIIGLENPGDGYGHLLNNAADGLQMLQRIGSDHVKLNYDFSNIYTLSRGELVCDPHLQDAIPYIGHLHLKNLVRRQGMWRACGLRDGIISYSHLFQRYPRLKFIPASLELPLSYGYDKNFNFLMPKEKKVCPEEISRIIQDSLCFICNLMQE